MKYSLKVGVALPLINSPPPLQNPEVRAKGSNTRDTAANPTQKCYRGNCFFHGAPHFAENCVHSDKMGILHYPSYVGPLRDRQEVHCTIERTSGQCVLKNYGRQGRDTTKEMMSRRIENDHDAAMHLDEVGVMLQGNYMHRGEDSG